MSVNRNPKRGELFLHIDGWRVSVNVCVNNVHGDVWYLWLCTFKDDARTCDYNTKSLCLGNIRSAVKCAHPSEIVMVIDENALTETQLIGYKKIITELFETNII